MYFNSTGPENTRKTAEIAVKTVVERHIGCIIMASNTGASLETLMDEAEKAGFHGQLVCVTHVNGFCENGVNEMSPDIRAGFEARGAKVYTGTHLLSGAERALSRNFQGVYPVEIIAHSLRMFGQGVKVCVEIAVMALDGGIIPYGEPVVAIGGTGSGLDTAVILSPAHASDIFKTRIHEVLCKPDLY
ncbi:MAG: hypothetical protein LBQ88_12315 [Treponema sp.]|nr:hypothetical protein [Treponema sp.]